jgi:sugar-specific transcriptional regulator TrmB
MKDNQMTIQLEFLGLSSEQAIIYQCLLDRGFIRAGKVPEYTGVKRGLAYKVLDQLIDIGLVKKHGEDSSVARYSPLSPDRLEHFVTQKLAVAKKHQDIFEELYGNLKSKFNLLSGRPSVQYFEGEDEVRKMLADSLETLGVIYTYADADMVEEHFPKLNAEHVQKRYALGIKKKILVANTKLGKKVSKDSQKNALTDIRVIEKDYIPFGAVAEIYDNKIAYVTASDIGISGVLIEDKQIANMHKFIFESMFEQIKK